MKQVDALRDRYAALAPREKKIVTAGGAVLLLIILWLAIVSPWLNAKSSLRARVRSDTELLAWMRPTAAEIKKLEKAAPSAAPHDKQSLFSTIERTAHDSPVGENIKNFKPNGSRRVQVRLENASFDDLIRWLGVLQAKHAILVSDMGIQQADAPGTVNADVTLRRPEQ
jgi:general secretion pathway protein M